MDPKKLVKGTRSTKNSPMDTAVRIQQGKHAPRFFQKLFMKGKKKRKAAEHSILRLF
jgi:hypothetical protein